MNPRAAEKAADALGRNAPGDGAPLASRASGAVAITETVVPKHDVAYDVIHDVTYDVNHEPRAASTHVNHEPVRPKTRIV